MSCTANQAPAFLDLQLSRIRQQGKVLYPYKVLVLCGVISGADGWTSIDLGSKEIGFRRFAV